MNSASVAESRRGLFRNKRVTFMDSLAKVGMASSGTPKSRIRCGIPQFRESFLEPVQSPFRSYLIRFSDPNSERPGDPGVAGRERPAN